MMAAYGCMWWQSVAVRFYSYIIGVIAALYDKFQTAIVTIKTDSFSDDFAAPPLKRVISGAP